MRNLVVRCIGTGAFVVAGLWLVQISIADELSAAPELRLETLLSTQLEGLRVLTESGCLRYFHRQ